MDGANFQLGTARISSEVDFAPGVLSRDFETQARRFGLQRARFARVWGVPARHFAFFAGLTVAAPRSALGASLPAWDGASFERGPFRPRGLVSGFRDAGSTLRTARRARNSRAVPSLGQFEVDPTRPRSKGESGGQFRVSNEVDFAPGEVTRDFGTQARRLGLRRARVARVWGIPARHFVFFFLRG